MTGWPLLGKTLVLATHNTGKVAELEAMLAPLGVAVKASGALGLPEPEETGTMFAENARIKAQAAAESAGLPALADDSGLCVDALDGAPGIFSARWGGPQKDFTAAMARLEWELGARGVPLQARTAHFVCALMLRWPDGTEFLAEGRVHGQLVFPPRGERGFGYDPCFIPDGHRHTFAEMDPAQKEHLSHRGRAMAKLKEALQL